MEHGTNGLIDYKPCSKKMINGINGLINIIHAVKHIMNTKCRSDYGSQANGTIL